MAFKTFASGVLTSSDVNTFLMRQAVITCTSSTRPASPSEGMTIYETDTDVVRIYSGSTWDVAFDVPVKTYTPNLLGTGWSIGNGIIQARQRRLGNFVFINVEIQFGSTSTFGAGGLQVTLQFQSRNPPYGLPVFGTGVGFDDSLSSAWVLTANRAAPFAIAVGQIGVAGSYATTAGVTATLPFTWAAGDTISLNCMYEAA
jgi:hypothetical protein